MPYIVYYYYLVNSFGTRIQVWVTQQGLNLQLSSNGQQDQLALCILVDVRFKINVNYCKKSPYFLWQCYLILMKQTERCKHVTEEEESLECLQ